LNLLRDLRAELGLTLIVISHDLAVIRYLADRVAVIYLGLIVETGETRALFEEPRHPYARMLLAATSEASGAETYGEFPNAIEPPNGCGFHPRCPSAMPICRTVAPPMRREGTRRWSCHIEPPAAIVQREVKVNSAPEAQP
jgi:peptide/nickel transport system ATP-binding protein